jgi:aldose 1-epimerase
MSFMVTVTVTAAVTPHQAQRGTKPEPRPLVVSAPFGVMPDGTRIEVYTLTNSSGMEIRTIPYGAVVMSIAVPDREGRFADVVLGHNALDRYVTASRYFGAVVGRYANRIANGRFVLDGKEFKLAVNNGPNHLHGGVRGFDKVVWDAATFSGQTSSGVIYRYTSPDGEEGYPGRVLATVSYTLTDRFELVVEYQATSDQPTPINLTQHTYFNLAGEASGSVLDHLIAINADRYTPVNDTKIPTGELAPVTGTPFDFRTPVRIGARIDESHPQLAFGGGYDHNFVLNRTSESGLLHAARVYEPASGRILDVATSEPGLQFNTANGLDGTIVGKSGRPYRARDGFCLETQHFPDSPNQPAFPSTILRPGQVYRSRTVYRFGIQKVSTDKSNNGPYRSRSGKNGARSSAK